VPASAFGLALAAAFLHAAWNVLIARARDPQAATAVALVAAIVVFAPVAAVTWDAERAVWPYILGTAALHLAYFALLAAAYGRAELSVVYPLARGLAPILVLAGAVVVLGVTPSAAQAAAVCLVGAGILLVRGVERSAPWTGVGFGLAIAACIAAYTLVDKEGIRHANPITYLELATTLAACGYLGAVLSVRGSRAVREELNAAAVLAGLAMFGAYALVLAALQLAPAAPVAAVRETSIVIATAGAAIVLKERFGLARIAGAGLVVAGLALLAL
jgi:drug/metabolite transporter (DMT)-like permease